MKQISWLILLVGIALSAHAQYSRYNTDSLLTALSKNEKIARILTDAETIYSHARIDSNNISPDAFKVAYLEKTLIDKKVIHIRHRRRYKNKKIISVADYTKKGNALRFATIDLTTQRILHDTMVSQGSGKGSLKNDKYQVPTFFSNTINSETSSLGLIATKKARQTDNPCHLCKYAVQRPHKDVVVLEGMEKGINDNIKKRDIVMHTTGSKDLSSSGAQLNIKDTNYRVAEQDCKCYRTKEDGSIKGIAAYASACGLAENNGYMGQSDGCLVLPEDNHIEIMETIGRRSLIFIYSNVTNNSYNYFKESPIITKIVRYSER